MTETSTTSTRWQPVPPPARGETDAAMLIAFHSYILQPGFSLAFHAVTLNRSLTSIATYRAKALQAAQANPGILGMVRARVQAISAEDGLRMAQIRRPAQLCHWSRIAIIHFRKHGLSRRELAVAFETSLSTISNVLQGKGQSYQPFSGERLLTSPQEAPSGSWGRTCARLDPAVRNTMG